MITFRGIALLICNSQEISTQGRFAPLKTNLIGGIKTSGLTLSIPIYVVVFLVITIIIWWLMKYTKYGRRVYAVGANRNAAYLAGIGVRNVVMSTYALNGLLVGIAAICLLSRVNTAIITVGQNLEIDVIAATVVGGVAMSGGKGNIWGTFIGAILLGSIANAMNILRLQSEWQFVAKGIIIIAAVTAGAAVQARARQVRQIK
jgi:ribose/xylose/arabinose/galactoside ABC-type transport system permease subunit